MAADVVVVVAREEAEAGAAMEDVEAAETIMAMMRVDMGVEEPVDMVEADEEDIRTI